MFAHETQLLLYDVRFRLRRRTLALKVARLGFQLACLLGQAGQFLHSPERIDNAGDGNADCNKYRAPGSDGHDAEHYQGRWLKPGNTEQGPRGGK